MSRLATFVALCIAVARVGLANMAPPKKLSVTLSLDSGQSRPLT